MIELINENKMFLLLFSVCALLLIIFNYFENKKVSYNAAKSFVGPKIYPIFGNLFAFFFQNAGIYIIIIYLLINI